VRTRGKKKEGGAKAGGEVTGHDSIFTRGAVLQRLARMTLTQNEPLRVIREFSSMEIRPEFLERDWCWLSVKYGYGNRSISLVEVLRAKKDGQLYIGAEGGWIDCESPQLDSLDLCLLISRKVSS